MKVKNSKRYLASIRNKLIDMQESEFYDIDVEELGRYCINLGKAKQYEDVDNYTVRELITLCIEEIDSQLI
jgi:hypothetical protein